MSRASSGSGLRAETTSVSVFSGRLTLTRSASSPTGLSDALSVGAWLRIGLEAARASTRGLRSRIACVLR